MIFFDEGIAHDFVLRETFSNLCQPPFRRDSLKRVSLHGAHKISYKSKPYQRLGKWKQRRHSAQNLAVALDSVDGVPDNGFGIRLMEIEQPSNIVKYHPAAVICKARE